MDNRHKLQRIVEGLCYDKGLEQILVKGVKAMPELAASDTLSKFVSYQETMPAILDEVATYIAEVESQQRQIAEPRVPRISRQSIRQPKSAISSGESAQNTGLTKDKPEPMEVYSSPQPMALMGLLDITFAWATVVATMMESYSTLIRVWFPSDLNYKSLEKPKAGEEAATAAVRAAIAASNSAFGNMRAVAEKFAKLAESNALAAERIPKKTVGLETKGRISRRK